MRDRSVVVVATVCIVPIACVVPTLCIVPVVCNEPYWSVLFGLIELDPSAEGFPMNGLKLLAGEKPGRSCGGIFARGCWLIWD